MSWEAKFLKNSPIKADVSTTMPPRLTKQLARLFLFSGLLLSFLPRGIGAEGLVHIMKDGETLYGVSRKYNIPLDTLIKTNAIKDPAKIRTGSRLTIPDLYEVKKGDTLYGIARKNGISLKELTSLNGLREDSILKPGKTLLIPRKAGPSPSQTIVSAPAVEKKPVPPANITKELFWPHPGTQKTLNGKLVGVSFEGKKGDPIYSVASGKVVWVGPYRGFGKVVFIQSNQGYIYVYAGNDEILVGPGDFVRRGQQLGELGLHPYEPKPNLYFIVYKDGKPVRPEDAPRI